jgi:hypothetical protein
MPWLKRKENGKWCIYKVGESEPVGACHSNEADADAQLAALHVNEKNMSTGNELDAEIFAVGKWNGFVFDAKDLAGMAEAFNKLQNNLDVALKFGHNDEQRMTDGQPALGWVSKVWVAGDKLMAKFVDLPNIVFEALQKKLYKNVSVELDLDVQYKGDNYPFVLTGVALLGADIPAVNTLNDLKHYLSRSAAFSAGRKIVFSAVAGNSTTGENIMDLKELTTKVAELTATVSTLTTENATLRASVSKFETAAAATDATEKKARIDARRVEITGILEDGVKTTAITPAQRDHFTKLLRLSDDTALMALDIAEVKALTASASTQEFSREQGKQHSGTKDNSGMSIPDQVVAGIQEILAKKEAANFAEGQALLFTRDPKLARAYVDFNK